MTTTLTNAILDLDERAACSTRCSGRDQEGRSLRLSRRRRTEVRRAIRRRETPARDLPDQVMMVCDDGATIPFFTSCCPSEYLALVLKCRPPTSRPPANTSCSATTSTCRRNTPSNWATFPTPCCPSTKLRSQRNPRPALSRKNSLKLDTAGKARRRHIMPRASSPPPTRRSHLRGRPTDPGPDPRPPAPIGQCEYATGLHPMNESSSPGRCGEDWARTGDGAPGARPLVFDQSGRAAGRFAWLHRSPPTLRRCPSPASAETHRGLFRCSKPPTIWRRHRACSGISWRSPGSPRPSPAPAPRRGPAIAPVISSCCRVWGWI